MDKRTTVLLTLFLSVSILSAQERFDKEWMFGGGYNLSYNLGVTKIDFSGSQIKISSKDGSPDFSLGRESGSFVCDKSGKVILYTDGCSIRDSSLNIIINGDSLNQGELYPYYCHQGAGGFPAKQSTLFLPDLLDSNKYYLFHKDSHLNSQLETVVSQKLFKSTIELDSNGQYRVVEKNKLILSESWLNVDDLSACRHSDGQSWWIATHEYKGDKFYTFLLSPNGTVSGPFIQAIGGQMFQGFDQPNSATFSPDGKHFAMNSDSSTILSLTHYITLFDFDNSTGEFSNPRLITYHLDSLGAAFGLSFSPNSELLYVSTSSTLLQVDFNQNEPDIEILGYVNEVKNNWVVGIGDMTIGPDCRIYASPGSKNNFLHVIHHPNLKGPACGFQPFAIETPTKVAFDLPNLPVFPDCDSTIAWLPVGIKETPQQKIRMTIYPNPSRDILTVSLPLFYDNIVLEIQDVMGRIVYKVALDPGVTQQNIDVSNIPSGIYFVVDEKRKYEIEKIVIMK